MLIFAAILAIFVYGMIAAMLGTILPDLSDRFRLTPTQNGTIAFSQALGLMIASLGVGPLLDTEGDKAGLFLAWRSSPLRSSGCRGQKDSAALSSFCFCSESAAASSSQAPMHLSAGSVRRIAPPR